MRPFALIAVGLLLLPAASLAQHAGGMAAGFHGGAVGAHPAISRPVARAASGTHVRTGTRTTGTHVLPSHRVHRASTTAPRDAGAFASDVNLNENGLNPNGSFLEPVPPSEFSFNNVPGLGFDFSHMAAVSGNQNFGGSFGSFGGFGAPFGFGGFLLSSPVVIETGGLPEQGPADETASSNTTDDQDTQQQNQRPEESQPGSRYGYTGNGAASSSGPAQSASAENDSRQYVFVRRDGSLVFAVAYSWEKDMLCYVTPGGIRRSISGDTLDLEATRQFNEQRGLNFHLPA